MDFTFLNRLIAALLIFGTCSAASAQHKAATSSSPAFATLPFDLSRESLTPLYGGLDATAVYAALSARGSIFEKSDFESSSDYTERLNDLKSKPLLHGMTMNDLYSFSVKPGIAYDADSKKMTVTFRSVDEFDDAQSFEYDNTVNLKWSETSVAGGSYTGSNAFGVHRKINRIYTTRYSIEINKPTWLTSEYIHKHDYTTDAGFVLTEDATVARSLSRTLRVLLIGSIERPFVTHETRPGHPTVDYPVDRSYLDRSIHVALRAIWLYDMATGDVITKYSQENFGQEWPVQARLQCDACNIYGLDVTIDGQKLDQVAMPHRAQESDPLELHAKTSINLHIRNYDGKPIQWKVTSNGTKREWQCVKARGTLQECTLDLP